MAGAMRQSRTTLKSAACPGRGVSPGMRYAGVAERACCRHRYRRYLHRSDRVRRRRPSLRAGQEPHHPGAARPRRHRLHPKSGLAAAVVDELIHGSTIAINTLIERKGAKTGLVVTRGTRDVYIIGRGNRPEAYNLFFHRHRPLVPRRHTHEAEERLLASGEVHEPLQKGSIAKACQVLKDEGVDAVAVCFLHSYVNSEDERAT